ncbi:MAG: hypothetical protein E5Y65_23820 [Mesorhizobium sp.]|uniref:DUF6065 family protein n=1 Tax=Mesorhizobium sp. TaxID=1871066 RepID=UPI001220485F|nr:DUF6065 family protein [Mesorhizobium sp.]TIL76094.1 MAG: hypothetical protein E5Y70_05010 [Mesorhizobium sp.]TIL87383.1 MAG: hypothetical protein E5Y65_23820 [Mesorhizobium sp.]TIL97800.1 MAG: hypothetical protein E5Y64_29330 [Mesorhizobium sp.]TIM05663.1 MAG: hypothetical protein E5Y62_26575 [Mesorhizobium sp.]TIM34395.1 MAG: hypothetical protein E5Y61_12340 [Mesorhizobium sp.]
MFHFSQTSQKTSRSIRFSCRPEDHGVIAPPVAAKTVLPDWFRKLPPVDAQQASATNNGLTVKRCMPFLDAMTTGWILPLAATVRLEVKDGGSAVDAGWEFDRVMVSNHGAHQVAGNPKEPAPPCKFHNYWSIRTPPGWSCLFLPPLNRPAQPFECVAGIVDTDTYAAHIHFPFFATAPDGLYVIEKGTPLVQVIPFRREDAALKAEIQAETGAEATEREAVYRNTIASEGWYRKWARAVR